MPKPFSIKRTYADLDGECVLRDFVVEPLRGFWHLVWVRQAPDGNTTRCSRNFGVRFEERKLKGKELVELVENIVGRRLTLAESEALLVPGGVRLLP